MKQLLSVVKYIVMLAAGVFLLWFALRDIEFTKLKQQIDHIQYGYIALAFVAALIAHLSRAARWSMLIKPLGYRVSVFNSFLGVMIGYLANLALPRM
jgi:uncharacterized membrane protein YbhN (UPF0104 family)